MQSNLWLYVWMDDEQPVWQRGGDLCRGRAEVLAAWTMARLSWPLMCVVFIVLGSGIYGATVGVWRGPLQGLYTAVKFPLLLCLVASGNALLNGLIAQMFGARLGFRQCFVTILMSFAIVSLVLGALSPVFLFLLWNLPAQGTDAAGELTYLWLVLGHVCAIALAGISANLRLFGLLTHLVASQHKARIILVSWLIGNLLLGAQLSWNLRPFFGSPYIAVEFFRSDAFDRNFFEALYAICQNIIN